MADDPFAKYATSPQASDDPFAKYAPSAPGVLESLGRGAVEGATFGFDDKIGMSKDAREASRKANPWSHFVGELAGAAVPMVAASLLPTGATQAAAAGRATQIAGKGLSLLRGAFVPGEISTATQALGQGAKLGATYSALSGAGHADVKDDDTLVEALAKRGKSALVSGTVGAAVGAPLGLGAHGLYRAAQNIGGLRAAARAETDDLGSGALTTAVKRLERDRITPDELIQQIRSEFPDDSATAGIAQRFWGDLKNKQPITADQVEETVRRAMAGESASDISTALAANSATGTGPGVKAVQSLLDELAYRHLGPLNIVDRAALVRPGAGENTQMTMRAAAATPGEHLGVIRENLLERQVGAHGRVGQLLDRMLGSSDYDGVAATHATKLQDAGARAYQAAFANERPFDLAPVFQKWDKQFDRMRGIIPDTMRARLKSMMWEEKDAAGKVVRTPPDSLQGFIYAREGIRDLIGELPAGNNLKRHLTKFYNEMTDEVASTNPGWKLANDLWRDGMAQREALEAGAKMTTRLNAGSRENLSYFTEAQQIARKAERDIKDAARLARKAPPGSAAHVNARGEMVAAEARRDAANARMELFKVGVVRSLNDMFANQGETHNLTRQLLLPGAQKMLRQVLGKDAEQFYKGVRAEAAMHRTYQSQFGSQTTPLREHVDELNWAPKFEASMTNPLTWPHAVLSLAQDYAARAINAKRNTELMRLYSETDPVKQLQSLRAMQSLHQSRSAAGDLVGRPAIGLGSGLWPQTWTAPQAEKASLPEPRRSRP